MEENEKKLMEGENEEENLTPPPAAENVSEENISDENETSGAGETSAPENESTVNSENSEIENSGAENVSETVSETVSENVSENLGTENQAPEIKEENGAVETSIKTFTQPEVDKLVGDTRVKTREKTFRYVYDRYGVKDEAELDALVANAQRYDTQKEMYDNDKASWQHERDENSQKLADMSEQIALMQSDIAPERYEDAKLILKGKGMEVTLENIQNELVTHPEWAKEAKAEEPAPVVEEPKPEPKPVMRIKTLGNESTPAPVESEDEQAQKIFKMKW